MADIPSWLLAAAGASFALHGWLLGPWPDRILARLGRRLARHASSSGPAGAPGLPLPRRDAAGPEVTLTEPEQALLDHIRHVTAGNPLADVIAENGRQLADACRQAMPDVPDLSIARLLLAQVAITHATLHAADHPLNGLAVCSDAMLGAVVDLCKLDGEVTTR